MQSDRGISQYMSVLLRFAWLIILATASFGEIGYVVSRHQTPIYQATTTISIQEAPGTNTSTELQSIMLGQQRIQTYTQLLQAKPLLQLVGSQFSFPHGIPPTSLTVTPVRETQLIRVSVTDTDPVRAANIANRLVSVFNDQRRSLQVTRLEASKQQLQQQLATLQEQIAQTSASLAKTGPSSTTAPDTDQLQSKLSQYRQSYTNTLASLEQVRLADAQGISSVVQEEPAEPPDTTIAPRILRNTALASLLGLLLSSGLLLFSERLNDKIRDPKALADFLDLPILGYIARAQKTMDTAVAVASDPRSPTAEAFRGLRTNIQFASVDRPFKSLLITSPSLGDGKSTVAVNLATVLAQGGQQVTIIDGDLRRPTLHQRLQLTNRNGLGELFVQPDVHVGDVLRRTQTSHLTVLTAGRQPPNPADLLASNKMIEILNEVQAHASIVIIDSPPVLAVTDPAILGIRADGVVLVVRIGKTKIGGCLFAVEQLRHVGANVIGIVVNDAPVGGGNYGQAYSAYATDDTDNDQTKTSRWNRIVRGPWSRRKGTRNESLGE
ncbi:MAG: polysaccharide biosynthesis tyrosine autokinase [Herpetosiphon sp.]